MLKRFLQSTGHYLRLCGAIGPILISAGCSVPSLNVVPGLPPAPTVPQLQSHIACVLARAMNDHIGPIYANDPAKRTNPDYVLWHNLVDYNFLGTINLTLFVTQSQGLNPSFNFITPLTSLGKPIEQVIESSNGITSPSNVTMNTNNFTLAVGFQLNGSQDHNFVLNYVVDMHRLYTQMYEMKAGTLEIRDGGLLQTCDSDDKIGSAKGLVYGLKGELALKETLETGLEALQRSSYAPVTAGSGGKSGQQTPSVSQTAGTTAFSSKIDFSLTWGINGGPGWNLLKFKGPSGGTGPGGQLLNYSRQKMDTLISTFSPTCKADQEIRLNDRAAFLAPFTRVVTPTGSTKFTSFQIDAFQRRDVQPGPYVQDVSTQQLEATGDRAQAFARAKALYMISIAIPSDETGLSYNSATGVQGTIAINVAAATLDADSLPLANSTVTWTGFVNRPGNTYSLRGSIADVESGSFVGYIYVDIGPDKNGGYTSDVRISSNAVDALTNQTNAGPKDYWQSLPFCSNSGPFLSNGLNILQQLPGGVSSALQQQR